MQILILSQILMPITIGANSSDEQNHGQGLAESREGGAWIIFVIWLVRLDVFNDEKEDNEDEEENKKV